MFPHITVLPNGLAPSGLYNIWLEIKPADDRRYKYVHKAWVPVSRADPCQVTQPYLHPDSPNTGAFWMQNKVSFARLKLTNNRDSQDGNVSTQHQFTPFIYRHYIQKTSPQRRLALDIVFCYLTPFKIVDQCSNTLALRLLYEIYSRGSPQRKHMHILLL